MTQKQKPASPDSPAIQGMFYQKLPSWQAAQIVVQLVEGMPARFGDMKDQVQRASLSIVTNIAEASARMQASRKNGTHLFASAKGSASETHSIIQTSLWLFAKDITAEYRESLRLALLLLESATHELAILVEDPKRALHPEDLSIFSLGDKTWLKNVLQKVEDGKTIHHALRITPPQELTIAQTRNLPERYECAGGCDKTPLPKSYGKFVKLPFKSRFLSAPQIFRYFFCNDCLKTKGKPLHTDDNGVAWKHRETAESLLASANPPTTVQP